MRRVATAVLAVSTVVLAGCANFAGSADREAAERAQLGVGTGGSTTTAGDAGSAAGGTGTGPGTTGTGVGGSTGAGAAAGHGGRSAPGAGTGPAADPGAPPPAAGNGGATDIGVTSDSVTVGAVATLSGPVPGLFRGAVAGVQAYFAYVNSEGGVYGRTLKVDVGDDGFSCSQNQSVTAAQVKKDFAEVGGFSLFDNCGAVPLKAAPGVPDVHQGFTPDREKLPNNFSVQPLVPGAATGPLLYFKSKFGSAYKHLGGLYADIGSAADQWQGAAKVMKSLGYDIVVNDGYSPTQTNFTSEVIKMRSKGVQMVYITGDAATYGRFMQACQQQNWHPYVTGPGAAYDNTTIKIGGSAAEGLYSSTPTALYFNKDDAARIPAVALYQEWMQKAAPGVTMDLFSVYGWSEAQMFVQALKAAGAKATRSGLLDQLSRITSFSNGIMAPAGPATKTPEHCYVIMKIVDGEFVRVDTPAGAYRCDGTWRSP